MADKTKIEWATSTWNPVTGCSPVSEGCQNCYAARLAKRFPQVHGAPFSEIRLHPDRLDQPMRWKKPRRIFVCSMSDIFHNEISDDYIDRVFAVMALTPQHTYLLLTKRPKRMQQYLSNHDRPFIIQKAIDDSAVHRIEHEELWRSVVGYEDLYEISNRGRVRRKSGGTTKGRRNAEGVLCLRNCRGYATVSFSRAGCVREFRVCRLVLEAFAGPPPTHESEARHKNGDPSDNYIENLSWGSKADNMADAARHGTAGKWARSQAKFTAQQVASIRSERVNGAKLDMLAKKYCTTKKHISAICLGKKYVHAAISWPLPNLWLGVTCENQARADERIPILLQIPAAKRFVSIEPMFGAVDLTMYLGYCKCRLDPHGKACPAVGPRLDWVIVGGETGPGARPMHPDWARSVRDQCQAAGVSFFFKQWGEWIYNDFGNELLLPDRIGKRRAGRVLEGRTWEEFPR